MTSLEISTSAPAVGDSVAIEGETVASATVQLADATHLQAVQFHRIGDELVVTAQT